MNATKIEERADAVRERATRGEFVVADVASPVERVVLATAALVGAMEQALDVVVAHTSAREQFGAPLRSFQGVQALLAHIAADVLLSRALLDQTLASGCAPGATRAAKVQASFAAGRVAAAAHQAAGAIGFTADHPLGALTSLMLRVRDEVEDEFAGAAELGAAVVASPDTWPALVELFAWDTARTSEPPAAT